MMDGDAGYAGMNAASATIFAAPMFRKSSMSERCAVHTITGEGGVVPRSAACTCREERRRDLPLADAFALPASAPFVSAVLACGQVFRPARLIQDRRRPAGALLPLRQCYFSLGSFPRFFSLAAVLPRRP